MGLEIDAYHYYNLVGRKIKITEITFEYFVESLKNNSVLNGNIHWANQTKFLIYKKYDNYFSLEEFTDAQITLKEKIDFTVYDTRRLSKHTTKDYKLTSAKEDNSQMSAFEILSLKRSGRIVPPRSLFTTNLIATVSKLYANDIKLYSEVCNKNNLMFT